MAIDWEKHLKNDEYFRINLTFYMIHFHDETNGISVVKGKITKTFKKWLKTQNIGDILLKEIEIREKKYEEKNS